MTFITESELREMWKNGRGQLPPFPPETRFSASAQDFINSQQLVIKIDPTLPEQKVRNAISIQSIADWDKPGSFPVVLTGPIPVCSECGQPVYKKPEHMTQLDAGHFAPKTNPRLVFRGRLDSLHALIMLTASTARRFELPELGQNLDTLAAYCREIMSAEYHLRPSAALTLMGKSEDQIHDISHWPDKHLGIQHIVPGARDHEILLWLNLLRTQCREVEIAALQAFTSIESEPGEVGKNLAKSLNRLSSAVYMLELYFQAGKISWKVTG